MLNLFCEKCGRRLTKSADFCDHCGNRISSDKEPVGVPIQETKIGNQFEPKLKLGMVILGIAFLAFFIFSQRNQSQLSKELQDQKQQTKDLLVKIQTNADATKKANDEISQQLADEKTKADQTSQALAAAQRKLAAQNTGSPTKTSSDLSLQNVNTKAIVLIVCVDSSGNQQAGSGVIIDPAGYVLTNRHVVSDNYGNLETCLMGQRENDNASPLNSSIAYRLATTAPNTGVYKNFDAAILKVSEAIYVANGASAPMPGSFPFLKPSPSSNLKQGDSIYILGYPGASNFVFSIFRGIVSSFSDDGLYINTDAVIDHGNSGGAAVTADGKFVGIPSQKLVSNNDYLGQILKIDNLSIPSF